MLLHAAVRASHAATARLADPLEAERGDLTDVRLLMAS